MKLSDREPAVLASILDFYDKFAERNETDSRLQGEAARAYRKMAALYHFLGREQEAEEAHGRALRRFETLVARQGADSEYQYDLARTLAVDEMPGAWAGPGPAEPDLRRAIAIVERLSARSPEKTAYPAALSRWNARLAARLEDLGRTEEAEACYRESIARDELLAARIGDASLVRWFQAENRDRLARLLIHDGRRDEARTVLEQGAADLGAIAADGRPLRGTGHPLAEKLDRVADGFHELRRRPPRNRTSRAAQAVRDRAGTRRSEPRPARRFRAPGPRRRRTRPDPLRDADFTNVAPLHAAHRSSMHERRSVRGRRTEPGREGPWRPAQIAATIRAAGPQSDEAGTEDGPRIVRIPRIKARIAMIPIRGIREIRGRESFPSRRPAPRPEIDDRRNAHRRVAVVERETNPFAPGSPSHAHQGGIWRNRFDRRHPA